MARLIDTSVFVELERRGEPIEAIARDALLESYAIASITASELLFGVEKADTAARRRVRSNYVESILSSIPMFVLDLEVARTQAIIWADLQRAGNSDRTVRPHHRRDCCCTRLQCSHLQRG